MYTEFKVTNSGLATCPDLLQNITKFFQGLQCVKFRELRGYSDLAAG